MKSARTKEELEGDLTIQQLHISTVENTSKETHFEPRKKHPRRTEFAIAQDKYYTIQHRNVEIELKTFQMNRYEAAQGVVLPINCFDELDSLQFELALRMRCFERRQYAAATLI